MPPSEQLSERELRVLEAVVQTYIETAEPAGSQTIARRFGLGVSAATIRNTMSDLEDKGFLFHPHTSAGRIPTERAYRVYVNEIMRLAPPSDEARQTLRSELAGSRNAIEEIVRRLPAHHLEPFRFRGENRRRISVNIRDRRFHVRPSQRSVVERDVGQVSNDRLNDAGELRISHVRFRRRRRDRYVANAG